MDTPKTVISYLHDDKNLHYSVKYAEHKSNNDLFCSEDKSLF